MVSENKHLRIIKGENISLIEPAARNWSKLALNGSEKSLPLKSVAVALLVNNLLLSLLFHWKQLKFTKAIARSRNDHDDDDDNNTNTDNNGEEFRNFNNNRARQRGNSTAQTTTTTHNARISSSLETNAITTITTGDGADRAGEDAPAMPSCLRESSGGGPATRYDDLSGSGPALARFSSGSGARVLPSSSFEPSRGVAALLLTTMIFSTLAAASRPESASNELLVSTKLNPQRQRQQYVLSRVQRQVQAARQQAETRQPVIINNVPYKTCKLQAEEG